VQPKTSETTGSQRPELAQPNSTGLRPGGPGRGGLPTTSDDSMRGWLLAHPSPMEADRALAGSLTSSHGVTPRVRTECRFPEGGGFYDVVAGVDIEVRDPASAVGAYADVLSALVGPTKQQAGELVAFLSVACIRRGESEATNAIALAVYSEQLRQFPADVARHACVEWARKNKWFPALAEIVALGERFAAPRRAVANRLLMITRAAP
jgi:hypothetical protein